MDGQAPPAGPPPDIHPLTSERWEDLAALFGPSGAQYGCWCMYWRVRGRDFAGRKASENRDGLRALAARDPAPGLLAYRGGRAVGWVGLGPRATLERLAHSRVLSPLDDVPVWSIVCFYVAREARGTGVADALLERAIDYARAHGAPAVEAYPVEAAPSDTALTLYRGTRQLFERAGFTAAVHVPATKANREQWIMRREIAGSS